MRLKPDWTPTPFNFPRGYGEASIPNTGDKNRPLSAAWWTREQILASAALDYQPGRIFLGRVDGKMVGVEDDRHLVTVAGSRGGKSACLLIPNLRLYEGSALVIDPKGELARETAAYRAKRFGHRVIVLDPWGVSGCERGTFDPLSELRADPASLIENAELVADALIVPGEGEAQHWADAARGLIRALVLWLVVDPAESGGSIARLPELIARLAAQARPNRDDQDEAGLLEQLAAVDPETMDHREAWALIRSQAEMMLGTGSRERASIFSTARTQLLFLDSPSMAAAVAASSLVLADLKRQPMTVYLCLPAARMATHSRWLRLILNLAVAALEREPTSPALPVLFVLEEFAALGHMRALEQAVAYMAGYRVKLWAVLQDLTQLKRHYKDGWETFLGNAGFLQAFSVSDLTTCEYLSKRLGETTFQITNKVDVSSRGASEGDTGLRREFKTAPLLAPDELAIKLRRVRRPDGTPSGLTLVLPAGDARAFVVDRVFHGELVE